jgi:hypothetical protein
VFTARYALSPYIKQICFVFKGLIPQSNATLRFNDDGSCERRPVAKNVFLKSSVGSDCKINKNKCTLVTSVLEKPETAICDKQMTKDAQNT